MTETRGCHEACSGHYMGAITGDNLLEARPDTESFTECRQLCIETEECALYTHLTGSGECFLLSRILEPIRPCSDCLSGPSDCADNSKCFLLSSDGRPLRSAMFTRPEESGINVTILADGHQCELRVLLVGGGGGVSEVTDSNGGGGSGRLTFSTLTVSSTTSAQIQVGGPGQYSTVRILGQELEARWGDSSHREEHGSIHGGDGYSGGAGPNASPGGSDGGSGEGYNHGDGSGIDLSSFPLKSFVLTPGLGGEGYKGSKVANAGGGGGGVLVDSEGPVRVFTSQGQGFGGGGCFRYSQGELMPYGLPGVILLEIEPLNNEAESNYI